MFIRLEDERELISCANTTTQEAELRGSFLDFLDLILSVTSNVLHVMKLINAECLEKVSGNVGELRETKSTHQCVSAAC